MKGAIFIMVLLVTTFFSQQKVKLQQNISQPKAKQSMFTHPRRAQT
jgi:uncharacterized membrane protein YwzB